MYFKAMNVYAKVPIPEFRQVTEKAPVGMKRVDVDKVNGMAGMEMHRSRLVARQVKKQPPQRNVRCNSANRCLGDGAVCRGHWGNVNQVIANGGSRAYMYAPARDAMYVKLRSEDCKSGEEQLCGRLNKSMYGTRPAAQHLQLQFTDILTQAGFKAGLASPCLSTFSATSSPSSTATISYRQASMGSCSG